MEDWSSARASRLALALSILSSLLAIGPARGASAQDAVSRPALSVALEGCEPATAPAVRRLLSVELGPDVEILAEGADAPRASQVEARCAESAASLSLEDRVTGKHLLRRVAFDASPPGAWARLIALAMAEMIAASWAELDLRHDEEVVVVGQSEIEEERAIAREVQGARRIAPEDTPAEEEAPPPRPVTRPFGVRAFGVGRISGQPFHVSGGGGIGGDATILGPLTIGADVRAEQGSVTAGNLGLVRATLVWGAIHVGAGIDLGDGHATAAVGLRGGAAILQGEPAFGTGLRAAETIGPVLGPEIAVNVSLRFAHDAFLHLGAQLTYVGLAVFGLGPEGELMRVGGLMMSLTVGFEVRPAQ